MSYGSPLFSARFEGECDDCLHDFDEGDLIGYTIEGSLVCRECWNDGLPVTTSFGDEDDDDEWERSGTTGNGDEE